MKKRATWIVNYCLAQLGRPYWRGTFGQHASPSLLVFERKRFPSSYRASDFEKQALDGQKVHDCCGLPKGAMLCDTVNGDPDNEKLSLYDLNPEMLYDWANVKGATMATFPKIPAYLVYNKDKSHVGVYVGNDEVVEARGHSYGVVKSKITDSRWQLWSDYCFADYSDVQPESEDEVKYSELQIVRKGSKGDAVRTVQANVKVTVDGIYGSVTEKAVKEFQRTHVVDGKKLDVDGIVGQCTWKAIIEGWSK